jgi:glycosyltransferase involved in cell wall biosynthesis
MSLLVSVIIPVRNAAPWLADAIDSCLNQTHRDLQLIVVDNGSSDASVEIARRYGAAVQLLACTAPGASAARNAGLARAEGAFIQFLDADDVLDREKIAVQVARLGAAPPGLVASAAWARFQHRPGEADFVTEPVWRDLAPDAFLISSWLGGGMMPDFAWLTPRAVIEKAGPWNERLSLNDDGEYFSRVVLGSSGILFCEQARGYYRTPAAATLSVRRDRSALASAFAAVEMSCGHLRRHSQSPDAALACATHYQRFAFDAYPEAPDLVEVAERRVRQLGGSELKPQGGRAFRALADHLGWKRARRCQRLWYGIKTSLAGAGGRH